MITKEIKNFIEFRNKLIAELVETFDSSIHPELNNSIDYDVITDRIISLIDEYEQKGEKINLE